MIRYPKRTIITIIAVILSCHLPAVSLAVSLREQLQQNKNRQLWDAVNAGNEDAVRMLIQAGANVNYRTPDGKKTPLMLAASYGSVSVIETLLRHKADIEAADTDHTTSLGYALRACQMDAAETLMRHGANIQYDIQHAKNKALIDAALGNCAPAIKRLVRIGLTADQKDGNTETPLSVASAGNKHQAIKALLHAGADPNIETYGNEEAPLYPLCSYIKSSDQRADIIDLFVQKGADVNCKNGNERTTPLMIAAGEGSVSSVKTLIRYKADIEAADQTGRTALGYALQTCKTDAAEILMQHGANVHYGNDRVVFDVARGNCESAVKILVHKGFDGNLVQKSYLSGSWIGKDTNGYQISWGLNIHGHFIVYAEKESEIIRYEGTWTRQGDFLVFNVAKAGSIEYGKKYIAERPFSMKLRILNLGGNEIEFELPGNKKRLFMKNNGNHRSPDRELDRRRGYY